MQTLQTALASAVESRQATAGAQSGAAAVDDALRKRLLSTLYTCTSEKDLLRLFAQVHRRGLCSPER